MVTIVISYWVGVALIGIAVANSTPGNETIGLAVVGIGALFQSFVLMLRRL